MARLAVDDGTPNWTNSSIQGRAVAGVGGRRERDRGAEALTQQAAVTTRELQMDPNRAQELIEGERQRIHGLLATSAAARADDLQAAADAATSLFDSANPLAQELLDDAVAGQLRARLAALDRASDRLRAGTYGLSLLSGLPIPQERLEADPAAELLVDEIG